MTPDAGAPHAPAPHAPAPDAPAPGVAAAAPDPGALVGVVVRARRTAAGLTVAELARRAEVSAPFVSQLESGRSSVSIAVLYRLARALGCAANDLLPATGEPRLLVRSGAGARMSAAEGPAAQRPRVLSRSGAGVLLEAYHYDLDPGDAVQDWFRQAGEVFVYVVAGRIAVEFADGAVEELSAGDSLHHEGDVPHRWLLRGDAPAEVVVTVTAGAPGGSAPAGGARGGSADGGSADGAFREP